MSSSISEPLRITDTGKYELSDYKRYPEIAISGAMLLGNDIQQDLNTRIRIMNKKTGQEFDRLTLKAFVSPTEPFLDKLTIQGKYFNPSSHFLKIESGDSNEDIHFLLYFAS